MKLLDTTSIQNKITTYNNSLARVTFISVYFREKDFYIGVASFHEVNFQLDIKVTLFHQVILTNENKDGEHNLYEGDLPESDTKIY